MNWKSLKFKDFLHRSKLPVDIADKESYKRVTIRIKHQGVSLRDTEIGKKIGTKKQFILKSGQFIMSKIDARQGAFGIAPDEVEGGIITGNFWAYDVNQKLVSIEWLNQYTNSAAFYDVCERASSGITHRKYLDEQAFLNHRIEVPDIKDQLLLVEQVGAKKKAIAKVLTETDQQLTNLIKLRQALLREAMQGQLLPQDPTDEPAAVLLQKSRAENAPQGKGSKRKAAPLFAEEAEAIEGPFEIPASWEWCRFSEIITELKYGTSQSCDYDINKEARVLRIPNVSSGVIDGSDLKYTNLSEKEKKDLSLEVGDLLMIRSNGSRELVGRTAIITAKYSGFCYAGYLIRVRMNKGLAYPNYILYALRSAFLREQIESPLRTTVGINNINTSEISGLVFPLPPLAEQQRIVTKLEQLMQHCDALEQRIRESRRLAEQLLQTALREALAPPADAEIPADDVEPELAEADTAPSPRRRGRPAGKGTPPGSHAGFGSLFD